MILRSHFKQMVLEVFSDEADVCSSEILCRINDFSYLIYEV